MPYDVTYTEWIHPSSNLYQDDGITVVVKR